MSPGGMEENRPGLRITVLKFREIYWNIYRQNDLMFEFCFKIIQVMEVD